MAATQKTTRPSLEGRLVEIRENLKFLRAEIVEAATESKEDSADKEPHPWFQLEAAGDCANGALKFILDIEGYIDSARIRGWKG